MALYIPEWLGRVFFYVALTLYIANELYFFVPKSFFKNIKNFFTKISSTIHDYRSGKYYKPWRSSKQTVIVSSKKQMVELSEGASLSQRAAYADMFGFKHTINNLDHHGQKVTRYRLYGRLLQVNGPANMAKLYPYLQDRLVKSLEQVVGSRTSPNRSISLPIAQTVRVVASRVMSLMFFGENISSDPDFAAAALRYPADMVKCMAAFQVTPSFLSPLVHSFLTNRGRAMHLIQDRLTKSMGSNRMNWDESSDVKQWTIIYNMSELTQGNDYWTPEVLSQALMGMWFAASHQPWMNLDFMILELCARPEWQVILRNEIEEYGTYDYETLEKIPLLDSFMKEIVRINPIDTLSIRRKAMADFTFSDGKVHVPKGSIACVSSYDLMHDESTYPSPDEFNGRRFVTTKSSAQGTKFTEVSEKFPLWGYGSLACPGRFHASLVMKMILSHFVSSYDMRFEDEKARRKWSWETFTMPYESTRILLTKRDA